MLTLKYFVCFAAVFSLSVCADQHLPQNQTAEIEKKIEVVETFEENQYAVYDALIADDDLIPYFSRKSKLLSDESNSLVIVDRTSVDFHGESQMMEYILPNIQNRLPSLSKAVFDDFFVNNKSRILLKDLFNLPVKRVFISDEKFHNTLKDGYFEAFYKKYPNSQGLMTLSNVGFNSQKKQALVYVSNIRGSLDAIGMYVVLEKQNNVWRVKEKYEAWVS